MGVYWSSDSKEQVRILFWDTLFSRNHDQVIAWTKSCRGFSNLGRLHLQVCFNKALPTTRALRTLQQLFIHLAFSLGPSYRMEIIYNLRLKHERQFTLFSDIAMSRKSSISYPHNLWLHCSSTRKLTSNRSCSSPEALPRVPVNSIEVDSVINWRGRAPWQLVYDWVSNLPSRHWYSSNWNG